MNLLIRGIFRFYCPKNGGIILELKCDAISRIKAQEIGWNNGIVLFLALLFLIEVIIQLNYQGISHQAEYAQACDEEGDSKHNAILWR